MSDTAKEQLVDHVDWLISHPDDQLTSLTTDLPRQNSTVPAPLEQLPEPTQDHVPSDLPPDGLPQAAVDHMSDTAKEQLADHVNWLISHPDDQLTFLTTDVPSQNSTVPAPLEQLPEPTQDHVPSDLPPDGLPQAAVDHTLDTAKEQLADHVDWLIS
jgi:hypothetical protein